MDKRYKIGAGILLIVLLLYFIVRHVKRNRNQYVLPANFDESQVNKGKLNILSNDFINAFDVSTWAYWTTPGIEENRLSIVNRINVLNEPELLYLLALVSDKGKDLAQLARDAAWTATGDTFQTRPDEVNELLNRINNIINQ